MKKLRIAIFALLSVSNLIFGVMYLKAEVEHHRLHEVEKQHLAMRNDVQADLNLLCQVNTNLEAILSMEIKKWKGAWENDMREICQ